MGLPRPWAAACGALGADWKTGVLHRPFLNISDCQGHFPFPGEEVTGEKPNQKLSPAPQQASELECEQRPDHPSGKTRNAQRGFFRRFPLKSLPWAEDTNIPTVISPLLFPMRT